jgi:hypothetical protein
MDSAHGTDTRIRDEDLKPLHLIEIELIFSGRGKMATSHDHTKPLESVR